MATTIAAATKSTATRQPPSLILHDRVAIVTGSSRGIGRAIALHLAQLGAKIVVNYTSNSAQAEQVATEINYSGPENSAKATTFKADVSDPDQVKSLFDSAEQSFGSPVHILVNCAGVLDPKYPTIPNTSLEDFDRIFSINARGAFLCCKEASSRLKQGGGGRIILLSSSMVGGLKPGYGAYAASKAAVEAMAKILAKELKGSGITVNCVAPGPIATEMFFAGKTKEMIQKVIDECPLSRLGETSDVVPLVGFLASDASEWVNGQVIRTKVYSLIEQDYI